MTAERRTDAAIEGAVRHEITRRLARRALVEPAPLQGDTPLADLGLGSLDLLELADALETSLGSNPFEGRLALTDMRTVGDLCAAYRPAPADPAAPGGDDLLDASRRRAEARRRARQP